MAALTPAVEQFILHWGEMGAAWGINRTVAQIHALLYLSERPLNAQEIAETLSLARSNVSTSIRELQGWRIVTTVHVLGDRRDHFKCLEDVWEMFRIIVEGRMRREVEPVIKVLEKCLEESRVSSRNDKKAIAIVQERLAELLDVFKSAHSFFTRVNTFPLEIIKRLMRLDKRLGKVLGRL